MSIATSTLNDVNLSAVAALATHIQRNPEAAQTTWKADVEWTGAFTSKVQVRSFAPIKSDEPTALGGADTAPNPVEQLLGASQDKVDALHQKVVGTSPVGHTLERAVPVTIDLDRPAH